ncbi:thiamine-monophosphate kinase [Mycobacterium sp. IS-1496]|uniref:thiamine-phosphate kinase n=1 Tax=Mycobacterium sp. IS-1496 TaxID=1772284 RepID=UPI00074165BC|nr:thiamine-phosphate kinase [Mycobacterium sp. IS-1496]KUI28149.1 thiamine-monophosphate kinase [Mycobacterium sp. IS-1496]
MAPFDPTASMADVGEFAVIDALVRGRRLPPSITLGPGDDAAMVTFADGRTVVSTDMLVQDRHFRLEWSTPYDVGRKAIAQNAADVEAMGATATAFVVAFGAPADTPAGSAVRLSDGMWDEAAAMGAGIAGGDLVRAPQWVISVTVLGDLAGRAPVRRDGARPGHIVAVTGELGRSAAGYELWHKGIDEFSELRRRHLVPAPPYGQGRAAADAGATAMTDVSDGLLADLGHIADASGCRIDVDRAALRAPPDAVAGAAAVVGGDPWAFVLGGGEDHALAAAFPGPPPDGWRTVGRVVAGPTGVLVDGGTWTGNRGWQSF